MREVYLLGVYSSAFGKRPDRSFKDLVREAYTGVLADAGLTSGDDIGFAWFGNCLMHHWGQPMIRGQACLADLVTEGLFPQRVPVINVEGGCATGSMAFHGAWKDVLSGQVELSVAIGVEKLIDPDHPGAMLQAIGEGIDLLGKERFFEEYRRAANAVGATFTTGPDRSVAMDTYALQARYHMKKYGTTAAQIAFGASKNHLHGSLNPKAQYRMTISPEEVLRDRMVSEPLTRAMCAPLGDGAAAALLCSRAYLQRRPPEVRRRAVRVLASVLTGGKYRDLDEPGLSRIAADRAYRLAGVAPADIDVAEIHDATSFCEIYQVEMLRFCPEGEGGPFVASGATRLGGEIPVNTSGGLVSKGHPIGATGLSMIYELGSQLRGEAGDRQVPGATLALQENGGGILGFEEAACSVLVLERAAS